MKIAYGFEKLPDESKAVYFIDPGDPVGDYEDEVLLFDEWFIMGGNQDINRATDYFNVCPISYLKNGSCTTSPSDTQSPTSPKGLTVN